MPEKRQLAAIMFTDIVGYTALMGKDENAAYQLLKRNRGVQKPLIEKHGGKWLKEMGDGVLASFQTISDAVYCAIEIQQICREDGHLKLRIGIHQGEVIVDEGDVFGEGVNIASRIEPLAPTGGIYISESVYRNIKNRQGIVSEFVREETLKNVDHPVRIYSVNAEASEVSTSVKETKQDGSTMKKSGSFKKLVTGIVLAVIVIFAGYLIFTKSKTINPEPTADVAEESEKSIAVLPFSNMSNDPDQEYFADGLSEELLNLLANIPELKVIARTSSFSFKGKNEDVREIGKKLGVAYLLEGSVRKSGNDIRITTQLIRTDDGSHLWSDTYDRQLVDIFKVQDEIAGKVVDQLKIEIPGLSPTSISQNKADAYNLLLEANYVLEHEQDSRNKAIDLLERAISLDSTNGRIWSRYASVLIGGFGGTKESRLERIASAKKATQKAIELSPEYAYGYWNMGQILFVHEWNFVEGEKWYNKAFEINPKYVGALWPANAVMGRIQETIFISKKGTDLDPLNAGSWWGLGTAYMIAGRPNDALEPYKRSIELNPEHVGSIAGLGNAYIHLGQFDKAAQCFDMVKNKESGYYAANMAMLTFAMGNIKESDSWLEKAIALNEKEEYSTIVANVFAQRGDFDKSFEWLEKAYENKDPFLTTIKNRSYDLYKMKDDPRFNQLLEKMGLPLE